MLPARIFWKPFSSSPSSADPLPRRRTLGHTWGGMRPPSRLFSGTRRGPAGSAWIPRGGSVSFPMGRQSPPGWPTGDRILESFLAEKLGVEPRKASGEACLMEHQVSDETIRKLSDFLGRQGGVRHRSRTRGGEAGGEEEGGAGAPISLSEYPEGTRLRVMAIGNYSRVRRLADVGLLPGESLVLKRRLSNGSVVVEVKGCDIALSSEVAACILVEEQG